MKETFLVEYYQQNGRLWFLTYGGSKDSNKIEIKHKMGFKDPLRAEAIESDYEIVRKTCLSFKDRLSNITYVPKGQPDYGDADSASLKSEPKKTLDPDAKLIKEALQKPEFLLREFRAQHTVTSDFVEKKIRLRFKFSKTGLVTLYVPEIPFIKSLSQIDFEDRFYTIIRGAYAEITAGWECAPTSEYLAKSSEQLLMDFVEDVEETRKVAIKLENLAEDFWNSIDELERLNGTLLPHVGEQLNELVQKHFFQKIEDTHSSVHPYLERFAQICLEYDFHNLAKELVKYFISSELFRETEKSSYSTLLDLIIQLIIKFDLDDYIEIDSDAERVRLHYSNQSFPVNINQFEVSTRLAILEVLHNAYRAKLLNKTFADEKKQDFIKKYNQVVSLVRSVVDKDSLREKRWSRLYAAQDLEYGEETKTLFKGQAKDAATFDEMLDKNFNILLFPTFGKASFEKQKITVLNEGKGCITNPELEIWQDNRRIITISVKTTFLAGTDCTFYLDGEHLNALKNINPNGGAIELHLTFKKFDNTSFRFTRCEAVSNLLEGLQLSELPDSDQLLKDIIDKAVRMSERKTTKKIEDLHNDEFTDWLRERGYYVTDQTRSGKSNLQSGEIDIMIRKENGTPVSIIEAFRLDSCGEKNKDVGTHLNKLLHKYDTVGHERNYAIVYAEAEDFKSLWRNYFYYVENLKDKPEFEGKYPLISFEDTEKKFSKKAEIKVGLAKHEREGSIVEVYHIFINMYIAENRATTKNANQEKSNPPQLALI